jgi:NitT/TauT family transport system ATP-binding protein
MSPVGSLVLKSQSRSPATRDPQIVLQNVTKRFRRGNKETLALSNVDLEVGRGELLAVVGPSGCGKSTLLRLVAGLLGASDGDIRVDGEIVGKPRTDVGIVFQKATLVDWRTVFGNVMLQAELRGLDTPVYRDRAAALLNALGLKDFHDCYPYELSGGMQQRASIARALLHKPPTLLMDEPFGALDALTREQLRLDVEALWIANRMTIMLITHSVDEAVALADRVIVMSPRPGRVESVFDVPMPRPRGLHVRKSPEFIELVDEITSLFLARGVLAETDASTLRLG